MLQVSRRALFKYQRVQRMHNVQTEIKQNNNKFFKENIIVQYLFQYSNNT